MFALNFHSQIRVLVNALTLSECGVYCNLSSSTYASGSQLWEDARKLRNDSEEENIGPAGHEGGTQQFAAAEWMAIFRYYRRLSYWLRQLEKFVRVRDRYLVIVFLAVEKFLIVRKIILVAN
jgi:hypothetical protein